MDYEARLLAALFEMSSTEEELMELFIQFLEERQQAHE